MALEKLTDITAFSSTLNNADIIHIVDVSDTTQDPLGSSYYLNLSQLKSFVDTNIYSNDGTTTSNRTVSLATQWLKFDNGQVGINTTPSSNVKMDVFSNGISSAIKILNTGSTLDANIFNVYEDGKVNSKNGYWINDSSNVATKFTGNNNNGTNTIAGFNSGHGQLVTSGNITYIGSQALGGRTSWGADNQIAGVGYNNLTSPTGGTGWFVLGTGCNTEGSGSYNHILLFASGAVATASNQMVVGGQFSRIDECWFGGGVWQTSSANFSDFKLSVAGIKAGTANTSASANGFVIAGAVGTGTGTGGDIYFKVAPAGGAGSSRNALQTALKVKQSGVINMAMLPTSATGLVAGDIWNNSGVLNIV